MCWNSLGFYFPSSTQTRDLLLQTTIAFLGFNGIIQVKWSLTGRLQPTGLMISWKECEQEYREKSPDDTRDIHLWGPMTGLQSNPPYWSPSQTSNLQNSENIISVEYVEPCIFFNWYISVHWYMCVLRSDEIRVIPDAPGNQCSSLHRLGRRAQGLRATGLEEENPQICTIRLSQNIAAQSKSLHIPECCRPGIQTGIGPSSLFCTVWDLI